MTTGSTEWPWGHSLPFCARRLCRCWPVDRSLPLCERHQGKVKSSLSVSNRTGHRPNNKQGFSICCHQIPCCSPPVTTSGAFLSPSEQKVHRGGIKPQRWQQVSGWLQHLPQLPCLCSLKKTNTCVLPQPCDGSEVRQLKVVCGILINLLSGRGALNLTWFLRTAGVEGSHSQQRNTWRPSHQRSARIRRETAGWPSSALWRGTEHSRYHVKTPSTE